MKDIYVINCCRTAIGSFGGTLKGTPAAELGAIVIKEALKRAGVDASKVDEVMMGNVLTAGLGQNPARQASVKAGVGMEHYFGLIQTWGFGMAIGLLVLLPYYFFGNWRSKGITDKAKHL